MWSKFSLITFLIFSTCTSTKFQKSTLQMECTEYIFSMYFLNVFSHCDVSRFAQIWWSGGLDIIHNFSVFDFGCIKACFCFQQGRSCFSFILLDLHTHSAFVNHSRMHQTRSKLRVFGHKKQQQLIYLRFEDSKLWFQSDHDVFSLIKPYQFELRKLLSQNI